VQKQKQKKKRSRDELVLVGGAPRPFVHNIVGVTTLSNKHKSEVTAYNKASAGADKAPTEMGKGQRGHRASAVGLNIRTTSFPPSY
jgi:hypothetical protein